MSETNFFGLSRGHYNPVSGSSRPLTVPERQTIKLSPSAVSLRRDQQIQGQTAKVGLAARPAETVKRATVKLVPANPAAKLVTAAPKLDNLTPKLTPAAPKPAHVAPKPTPAAPKPSSPIIPVDDLLNDFIDNKPKAKNPITAKKPTAKLFEHLTKLKQARIKAKTASEEKKSTAKAEKSKIKAEKSKIKAEKSIAMSEKTAAKKMAKQAKPPKTAPSSLAANSQSGIDFAAQALTAAADMATISTGQAAPTNFAMSDSGEVTVDNRLPRVTLELKINKQRILAFLRAILILAVLAVSGYLAWDTYMTNRAAEETFSNPVAAVAINETNPADADTTSISSQAWAAYTVPADQARYIYLPTVGDQARVLSVGVNSKGRIDTSSNVNDTAWYDGSAKPGQEGQVFINGHTASAPTYKAAFDDLPKLQVGDQIIIERGDGKQISYRVVSNETIKADQVNMKKVLNVPDGATKGLTIMSCTGKFNYRTESSDTRVIVYAVQE